ncbi:hypothetical protein [Saccharothrix sp. Mg75]|uniref:hypothetical protein n=1 Tax=Saccharothrix sp. Mg75 TaxID=3445357 RepID=UPI003EE9A79E
MTMEAHWVHGGLPVTGVVMSAAASPSGAQNRPGVAAAERDSYWSNQAIATPSALARASIAG